MIRRYIAFVALASVPALALAQRGSGTHTQSTEKTDLFKGTEIRRSARRFAFEIWKTRVRSNF